MVSPSFWAWRENRIKTFNKKIDLMLCLFPFEEKLLEEQGLRAIFIGHPLADSIPIVTDQIAAKTDLGIDDDLVICLMPGSRRSEISFHAKLIFDAANKLKNELATSGLDRVRFLVPSKFPDLKDILIKYHPKDVDKYTFLTDSKRAISASNLVITKSGTSTLESALYKKPTVVIYKMPTISYLFLKLLNVVKTEFAALPNILLEKEIFPELIQNEATSENIKNEAINWINQNDTVDDTIKDLTQLHKQLRMNAGEKAAQIIEKAVAS
jgi:lipid-A-disaccharide synthase